MVIVQCTGSFFPDGKVLYGPMKKPMMLEDGIPRVGDKFAVQCAVGRAIFRVRDVVWEEDKPVTVVVEPHGSEAKTSFGGRLLDACGWSQA